MFALAMCFLIYPLKLPFVSNHRICEIIDWTLSAISIILSLYIIKEWPQMVFRLGIPNRLDIICGAGMVLLTIEIARRATGNIVLPLISGCFILYALFGYIIPGHFSNPGFPFERVIGQLYLSLEGIYGYIMGVMVRVIFPFILFGAFFQISGIGENLIEIVLSITRRFKDGPAQSAVISSGLFGSISGVGAANVMATGSFTIPLMKKLGYKDYVAAGIEAAASSGGLILPPVMGAGVFIMVEWTGIPYAEIIKVAAMPAIIYYISVAAFVHFRAMKMDVGRLDKDIGLSTKELFKKAYEVLIPPAVILWFIFSKYTPTYAAFAGTLSIIVVMIVKKGIVPTLKEIIPGLELAGRNSVITFACCASAGIIVGMIGLTGIGAKLSSVLLSISKDNLFLAVTVVSIAGLILGMGLPVSVSYVVLVSVAGAALQRLGLPILSSHLIVFWASTLANVTPPVCVSAYAAASIAKADPMKTAIFAFAIAKGLFIIIFFMAFTPLLTGTLTQILFTSFFLTVGLIALSAFLEGFLLKKTAIIDRIFLLLASILLLNPLLFLNLAGLVIFLFVILWHKFRGPLFLDK